MGTLFARGLLTLSLGFMAGGAALAADPPAATPSLPAPGAEAPEFNPSAVPKTTEVKPLLEFIEQVSRWQPKLTPEMKQNPEAMAKANGDYVASRVAMITAIDKVLEQKPEENRVLLLPMKVNALRAISMVPVPDGEQAMQKAAMDYEALTESLAKDKDPELARSAQKTMLAIRMRRISQGRSTESVDALIKDLSAAIDADETRAEAMMMASSVTYILEMKGQYDAAKGLYQTILRNAGKLPDPRMQKQILSRAEGGLERLNLLGQIPDVKGVQLDGKPFDIAALKGKVVLIDFWATWCGPCRAELPNVIKNYEQYHKAGFEVVGISIDDDRAALDEFIKEQPLPWTTLFNPDEATRGFEDPTARKFHVGGIPATYLVDQSGKLVHVNVRGDRLGELLKSYYPDVK